MRAPVTTRGQLFVTLALVGLGGCSGGTDPEATLTAAAVAASNGQAGLVGTALPLPLRVEVASDGTPKEGVTVTWQTTAGSVAPTSSLTDVHGVAATSWTLGSVPGAMTLSATVAGAQGSPVSFNATALPSASTTAVAPSNNQTGVVGTALSLPLRVQVQIGERPAAEIAVSWQAYSGSIAPASTVTDGAGMATAVWTLGTNAGGQSVQATIAGAQGPHLRFDATAVPGSAVAIDKVSGDGQTVAANRPAFPNPMVVAVRDQYENLVEGEAVAWTVERGPVSLLTAVGQGWVTDAEGQSTARLAPRGAKGEAVVRAALSDGATSVSFEVSMGPPELIVLLQPGPGYPAFVSQQNNTSPAVDTIRAGETMEWIQTPFDYDQHRVVSVGDPSFQDTRDFPYGDPSIVRVRFAVPGTYHYTDFYYPLATGIIVVR